MFLLLTRYHYWSDNIKGQSQQYPQWCRLSVLQWQIGESHFGYLGPGSPVKAEPRKKPLASA
jgi:hypothetical protein